MSRLFSKWWTIVFLLSALASTACSQMTSPFAKNDRTPPSDTDAPTAHPEWASDAPSYAKAPQELTPEAKAKSGDPPDHFTKDKIVMIRRPEGLTAEEAPRVAIWWTDNNGFRWNNAGYFGPQQASFPFEVTDDGDYGVRFVGPGQEPELHAVPLPERVYHVDTTLPEITIDIQPEQTWYHVGDVITISWKATDFHLTDYPVRIGILTDSTGDEQVTELQRDLADRGSIKYTLPQDTLDHEIRFRGEATDRAGNLGFIVSYPLQIVPELAEEELADARPANDRAAIASNDPPAQQGSDESDDLEPTTLSEQTRTSAMIPRTLAPLAETESTAPPATAANRSSSIPEKTEAEDESADSSPATPGESAGGAFTLPASLAAGTDADVEIVEEEAAPPDRNSSSLEKVAADPPTPAALSTPEVHTQRPSDPVEPFVATAVTKTEPLTLDMLALMKPCDLVIPLPATVEQPDSVTQLASAHPWRILDGTATAILQTIWNLPRPNFGAELNRLFDVGTLADWALARPVAEPPPPPPQTVAIVPERAPRTNRP